MFSDFRVDKLGVVAKVFTTFRVLRERSTTPVRSNQDFHLLGSLVSSHGNHGQKV